MANEELPILTVSQLTHAIKLSLEGTFPFVCLQGEISNFKVQSSGHYYFSLKDSDAQISAVMFRGEASQLKTIPKGGDHVIIKGSINVYPTKGNYQIIVKELSFAGVGILLQKLEELKIKLHKLGWFKKERKRPIPHLPKRIGVVTSPTGAVIQDILHVLTRRFEKVHLILNPVKVQGEGAAQEIAKAIEQFNNLRLVDVMIVGRGGGTLEDLWAFNEEIVAEAIFKSEIPVICAVGHETDHCIAEYVADVRAPTPSAAAEMVMAEKDHLNHRIDVIQRRIHQIIKMLIQRDKHRLERFSKHPLIERPKTFIDLRLQRLDEFREKIDEKMNFQMKIKKHLLQAKQNQAFALSPMTKLAHFKQKIALFDSRIHQLFSNYIERRHQKLTALVSTLKAIDPKNLLKKGYSILISEKENSVVSSVKQINMGDRGRLLVADGEAIVTVDQVYKS